MVEIGLFPFGCFFHLENHISYIAFSELTIAKQKLHYIDF